MDWNGNGMVEPADWLILLAQLGVLATALFAIFRFITGKADRQATQYKELAEAIAESTQSQLNSQNVIAEVQARNRELRERVGTLEKQVGELQEIIAHRADRILALERENALLKAHVAALEHELAQARVRIAELERKSEEGQGVHA